MRSSRILVALVAVMFAGQTIAAEVNVYSARKDKLIVPLLDRFTEQTGIEVNLITGKANALLSRIKAEGIATPADVLVTVDAGNLHRAKEAGVLSPVNNAAIKEKIPANLRDVDSEWFGLTNPVAPNFLRKGSSESDGALNV